MSTRLTSRHVEKVDRIMNRYGVSPKEAHEALEEADWNVWEAGLAITTLTMKIAKEAARSHSH